MSNSLPPPAPTNYTAASAIRNVPTLIAAAKNVDPALAAAIEGKALIQAKSPWGTVAVALVSWLAAKYGFGWGEDTNVLVAGLGVLVGSYVMRYVTVAQITGLFTRTPPAQLVPAAPVVVKPLTD
jgi:CHASE2 domain-containing sensor protein